MLVLGHFVLVLFCLLVYAVSTHLRAQRRHPSAAIAWVLLIALLPYLGLPLYLIFGSRKVGRPERPRGPRPPSNMQTAQDATVATLEGMGLAPPTSQRLVRFHRDGAEALDELLMLIGGARQRLDICTYVLGSDAIAQRIGKLLAERAAAGVRVRMLLDAMGSLPTSRRQLERLRAAGVQVRWFMPLLHNAIRGRVNLRNHRKLAVADAQTVWSGGRNLAAEYFSGDGRHAPWIDASFTVEGPLAAESSELFESHWQQTMPAPDVVPELPARAPATATGEHLVQLVPSGPDQADDTLHDLLLTEIFRARQRVLVVTPYFIPDDTLLTALCLAARRGVEVELILPARSNHLLADIARQRALRELTAATARVRMTESMMHAKAVVVDDTLALCGSLNLDARSLFLNYELMMAFYTREDIDALRHWVASAFRDTYDHVSRPVSLPRDIMEGLVRWVGFQV